MTNLFLNSEVKSSLKKIVGFAFLINKNILESNINTPGIIPLIGIPYFIYSRRPSGLRKTMTRPNSLAHRTTWLWFLIKQGRSEAKRAEEDRSKQQLLGSQNDMATIRLY